MSNLIQKAKEYMYFRKYGRDKLLRKIEIDRIIDSHFLLEDIER